MSAVSGEVNVRVAVRVRPLLPREKLEGEESCVRVVDQSQLVIGRDRAFTFDHAFGARNTQQELYNACVRPLIDALFEGYNATVFAYGQTSAGKTYTMGTCNQEDLLPEERGVIPRAVADLFSAVRSRQRQHSAASAASPGSSKHELRVTVKVTYIEIYKEEIRDLLDPERTDIRLREDDQGNTILCGASETFCPNEDDLLACLEQGSAARVTGATQMNEASSRSHCVFCVTVTQEWSDRLASGGLPPDSARSDQTDIVSNCVSAKFNFVDLAGSERAHKTGNVGARLKESIHINTGLLALGNVISALADPAKRRGHVPYREAKITRLLKDALGGSSRTLMVCCVSPALSSYDESLNSLKYANRAKHIRNKPIVHRDKLSAHLHEMQSEILALREQLGRAGTSAGVGGADSAWASVGGDEARLRFELDHLRCLADRARALLTGDPRAADWMDMYDELGNRVPSLPDEDSGDRGQRRPSQQLADAEQTRKLQQDLEKARQDLANDEEIFAEKSREAWALGDRCRALEAELAAATAKAAYLENKLLEKQQQQLDEDFNNVGASGDAPDIAKKLIGGDSAVGSSGRAQSVPLRRADQPLQQSLLMLPGDRAVRTSPGLFDLDRVLRCCRARSELLFAQLDDSDSVLCHHFDDEAPSGSGANPDQQQQQQAPFVRKGTFRLGHKDGGSSAAAAAAAAAAATAAATSASASEEAKRQLKASQIKLAEANQKVRDLQLNINMKEQLIRDLVKSTKQTAQVNHKYEEQVRQLLQEQQACEREQREAQARLDELASARRSNASVGSLSRLKAEHEARLTDCAQRLRDIRARLEEAQRLAGITGSGRERRVAELEAALERMRAELNEARGQLAAEADAKKRLEADAQKRGVSGGGGGGDIKGGPNSRRAASDEPPGDERTAWLDAEVDKAVKQRQELRQLEDELRNREAILAKREALLAERAECEISQMRAGGSGSGSDRLQELDEALAALDEALGLRNEAISAREGGLRQSQLSLSTSQDALFSRLGALSAAEAKRLVAANFRRLVQLRAALAEEESRRAEARLRLEELGRDKERLERSLQRAAGETERRITRLQAEYEAQIQLLVDRLSAAEAEAARLPQTERELAVYKKTSRELKRKIRDWVSSGRLLNAAPADLDEVAVSSSHRQSIQQQQQPPPPPPPLQPQTPSQQQQQQSSTGGSRPTSVRVSRREVRELSAEQLSARGSHRQSADRPPTGGAGTAAAASIVHDSLDDD